MLQARAQFKRRSTANNVEILVPVPEDADSPRFRTNIGSVHYAPEKSAIIWKIKQFGGGKEFLMRAELGLPSVKGDDEHGGGMTGGFGGSMGGAQGAGKGKRPISVKFEIPYFTTSGIQVRYLKIIEPKVSLSFPSFFRLKRRGCHMISSLFLEISSSCVDSLLRGVFMFSIGGGKQGGMLTVGRIGFHHSCVTKPSLVAARMSPPPRSWSPVPEWGLEPALFLQMPKPHVLLGGAHAALHNIPSLSC